MHISISRLLFYIIINIKKRANVILVQSFKHKQIYLCESVSTILKCDDALKEVKIESITFIVCM